MIQTWRIDAGDQTLALASWDGAAPCAIHWGARLPAAEDLTALARAHLQDLTGGMIDVLPPLSLSPEASRGWQGHPGLVATRGGLPLRPHWSGCTAQGVEPSALVLQVTDPALGLTLEFAFAADAETGIVTATTALTATEEIAVAWLAAPALPGPDAAERFTGFTGRWTREFQPVPVDWRPGLHVFEARLGRSGHEYPPFAIFPETGATDTCGRAFAMHYGWSGGHRMLAEELADGRRQVQWGHAGHSLRPGTRLSTAPLLLAVSDAGLNGCAVAFQRHIRDRIVPWPAPDRPRPVHYNCWEAVYFDHDLAVLTDIATRAADLGAERFVLDDGWFGRRDDDRRSLGDWTIDRRKWPDGLTPLVDHVKSCGMSFGLWVEPEMVNPDSDLARAHPDWLLGPADQPTGRHQMVLDMARPALRDHLFEALSAILGGDDIDYLKWDHNRLLPVADAAQTDGIYALLDRLRAAFPALEIESCASGGGRIDAGILARTQRVWLSDSNDALERLRIQADAARFLPAAITGSHVGPRHCHTSGRVLPMELRAWVAAQRHMGFEMDPRELTDPEADVLRTVTAWWKANRDWTMRADILRLPATDPAVVAELQLARDGARFVVFAAQGEASAQSLPRPLRLAGLDPDARYRLHLLAPQEPGRASRGSTALAEGDLTLSGRALMTKGLQLPVAWPATMRVLEGTRL